MLTPENKTINGFWMNGPLTNIQRLSIKSFLDNGHSYRLWTYDNSPAVTRSGVEGVEYRDASNILPLNHRDMFQNDANFSDWFRTNLLVQFGGWYADTDIVCLRPFDFPDEKVFVSEYQFDGKNDPPHTIPLVNGCIVKLPAGDDVLRAIRTNITLMDTKTCGWCDVGPNQFRWGVRNFSYERFVHHPNIFDSLWPTDLAKFVSEGNDWNPHPAGYAIHLRTSYWKPGSSLDQNKTYSAGCWFEYLKRRHQIGN